jgi:hypothetical protein
MKTGSIVRSSLTLAGLLAAVITASIAHPVSAQSVAQSYTADDGTQAGMLVQLDDKDDARVKPAESTKPKAVHGIVVLPNDAPLSLTEATNERQVYVATTGTYKVLVSDQNGPIRKDDFLVVSSIDGVGMLADSTIGFVAGRAVGNFDGTNNVKSQTKVTDSNGKERTVHFGYLTANINIARNPLYQNSTGTPGIPGFLQRAVEAIVDKPVSPVRAYISLILCLLTTVIVVVVMTSGIRASVISIGRNPMARKSIVRNLVQVILVGLMILIVGLFGVYLLLKI